MLRESLLEKKLCDRIKALGGMAEKFTSPGRRSVPDRIITFPNGKIIFVEVKRPGAKPTKLQQLDHEKRRKLGFKVIVIDSFESIDHHFPIHNEIK